MRRGVGLLVFEVFVGEFEEVLGVAACDFEDFGAVVKGLVDVASVGVKFGEGFVGEDLVVVDAEGFEEGGFGFFGAVGVDEEEAEASAEFKGVGDGFDVFLEDDDRFSEATGFAVVVGDGANGGGELDAGLGGFQGDGFEALGEFG